MSEDIGQKLEDADLSVLGSAKTIIITKDSTIIMGGAGSSEEVAERVEVLVSAIENTTSDYDADKL